MQDSNLSPLSVEIWPARTPVQQLRLDQVCEVLAGRAVRFVSITYGAGGSRRDLSLDLVKRCVDRGLRVYAHLVVVGHSRSELRDLIGEIVDLGASGIVALRGDSEQPGELNYASELVEMIGGVLPVAVAAHPMGHPQSHDSDTDLRFLVEKLQRASFGITQFYTEANDYRSLVSRVRAVGSQVPIVPGVLVPLSPKMLFKMGEMAHIAIPSHLRERLTRAFEEDRFYEEALQWALALASDSLQAGAPWIHLFSMNSPRVVDSFSNALDSLNG